MASAIKELCFSAEERTARFKRYRLMVVYLPGRMSRFANTLRLRLCASTEAIARLQRIWEIFCLPTQARADEQRVTPLHEVIHHPRALKSLRAIFGVGLILPHSAEEPSRTLPPRALDPFVNPKSQGRTFHQPRRRQNWLVS